MKILCVIDSLCFGGAQRQLVELAFAFKEKGHFVTFLTYHHIPFFNSEVEQQGIQISCIEEPNYIRRLFKMRRFIRRGNYHAVLSFLEGANFISEFAGFPYRSWKLVVGERSANPKILKSLKLIFYRWFHFFANYIVANSNSNMYLVRSVNPLLPGSKCQIIYNTVDFSRFKPLKNFVFWQENKLSLVIAARIQYEKNFTGLMEALLLLDKDELSKLKIDWYGEYNHQPNANALLVKSLNQLRRNGFGNIITFHKATHEIRSIIQESDAVGLFSFYEGFPNIICEAMACEKPVICTKVSDVSNFLSHEPNLLCDPANPHSIKESLRYLIQLNRKQLKEIGIKNRIIALERFEKETIVSDYLRLLGEKIHNN
ncbi:MAG: glycosyltransferase [Marinilabiliaceae bacterium]|nr:glycosyltransferase [Marinilabiliaceae bacterium]